MENWWDFGIASSAVSEKERADTVQRFTDRIGENQVAIRATRWEEFIRRVGRKRERDNFANFDHSDATAAAARQRLMRFCGLNPDGSRIANTDVDDSANLILLGPCGTGKDHLLIACARRFIQEGRTVDWINAEDFAGMIRDNIATESRESRLIWNFGQSDIWYVSDLVGDRDAMTDHQKSMLYRVLDHRANRGRPVWVSCNAESQADVEAHLGPRITDRLTGGAVIIRCTWSGYREPAEVLSS